MCGLTELLAFLVCFDSEDVKAVWISLCQVGLC